MAYDIPLILSLVVFLFSVLGFLSAVMEKEPVARHLLSFAVALILLGYAWYAADGELTLNSVPEAFLRIVAKFS